MVEEVVVVVMGKVVEVVVEVITWCWDQLAGSSAILAPGTLQCEGE